jgi:DNA-binding response OmpR family regulator
MWREAYADAMAPASEQAATAAPEAVAGAQVLLIEDEPGIVDFVRRGLEGHGFRVKAETDGVAGERAALEEHVDVVVLDLMLPRRSGLEVLATLHSAKPELPVVVLTARGEVEDRVAGLDLGAVDYLVKPFSLAELAARIRAHLRSASLGTGTRLEAEDVELELLSRKVRRQGKPIALSSTEFELLAHLMRNHDRVVGREEILSAVWGYQHDPATNIVDVYIGYLRRKLRLPDSPAPIQTVRSVGYRFGRAGS